MCMDEDPYTSLARQLINLKDEVVELQDAIHNLTAALLDGVFD